MKTLGSFSAVLLFLRTRIRGSSNRPRQPTAPRETLVVNPPSVEDNTYQVEDLGHMDRMDLAQLGMPRIAIDRSIRDVAPLGSKVAGMGPGQPGIPAAAPEEVGWRFCRRCEPILHTSAACRFYCFCEISPCWYRRNGVRGTFV